MKFTTPDFNKIRWLFSHPGFKAKPGRTLSAILKWELIRLSGKPIKFIYDNDLNVLLYPEDGIARLVYYFNNYDRLNFGS